MDKWRHTGFNVFCGQRILPRHKKSMENLARYTCPPMFVTGYPGILFPGKDGIPSGIRPGGIPIKGWFTNKGI
jgi:hypothetical protein